MDSLHLCLRKCYYSLPEQQRNVQRRNLLILRFVSTLISYHFFPNEAFKYREIVVAYGTCVCQISFRVAVRVHSQSKFCTVQVTNKQTNDCNLFYCQEEICFNKVR